jgi:hypothetical protein
MMKTALNTCQDLAACFAWKQVGLGFPSLASRLVEARRRWCTLHHVEVEDGQVDATDCIGPFYHSFAIFIVLGPRGILVFCLDL